MTEKAERQGALNWDSIPRRLVTLYIPLMMFILVLLFPFYWMTVTTFKPNNELYNYADHNPFWVTSPTLQNVNKLLFETDYPHSDSTWPDSINVARKQIQHLPEATQYKLLRGNAEKLFRFTPTVPNLG